mmetsp:Transcript_30551/g.65827  ORF Transcript_30551/g.65827 Transcript_30551/m.65827 type:complete len:662 (+) Transcript_30551:70-2055(+)|eukprot:CAMPEP_0206502688 /NCGR_PEP_ID=MMETSP0324_2-20121206/54173_1 /ASSEMBLY_ACC=CAM_ASM_000836 /TAXON_ID=2866 /ORGANISM="Crypthecodinium cohnii, Strain Seligo" /LENGTH=661 /DNA_ID=CAMNT_0053990983 /DNA_START=21 /DNA_END=2006 /DNA_ORIENTATION=-
MTVGDAAGMHGCKQAGSMIDPAAETIGLLEEVSNESDLQHNTVSRHNLGRAAMFKPRLKTIESEPHMHSTSVDSDTEPNSVNDTPQSLGATPPFALNGDRKLQVLPTIQQLHQLQPQVPESPSNQPAQPLHRSMPQPQTQHNHDDSEDGDDDIDEEEEGLRETKPPPLLLGPAPDQQGRPQLVPPMQARGRQLRRRTSDASNGGDPCWARSSTPNSVASSGWEFAEPTQTLVFLDWDDTLFPCTELFDRWKLPRLGHPTNMPPELECELAQWRTAIYTYLKEVCAISNRCVIVTNSSKPWVESCIERFAPELHSLLASPTGPFVAYAGDVLRQAQAARRRAGESACCCPKWWDAVQEAMRPQATYDEKRAELTRAKLAVMRTEAKKFYSSYVDQTWKNIISLGDMKYERDAVKELGASRAATKLAAIVGARIKQERLRIKACVLPAAPTLSELTLWIRLFTHLLPVLAKFDGDVDLDLNASFEPLQELSKGLSVPSLASMQLPRMRSFWSLNEATGPGFYRAAHTTRVQLHAEDGSPTVSKLQRGDVVEVVEVQAISPQQAGSGSQPDEGVHILRGRVNGLDGWVTLMNEDGKPLLEKEDFSHFDEMLDGVAAAIRDQFHFGLGSPIRRSSRCHSPQGGASPLLLSPGSESAWHILHPVHL